MNKYITAKIVADSLGPTNVRLTTFELTFPRYILAEYNTHAMIRRNAASSRAIPAVKRIKAVEDNPFLPVWGERRTGMQSGDTLEEQSYAAADKLALDLCEKAIETARALNELNVHKQFANRYIEPWSYCTIITTATDWANFFAQRTHAGAEPSFQELACKMKEVYDSHTPTPLKYRAWHAAYLEDATYGTETGAQIDRLEYPEVVAYLQAFDDKSGTVLADNYSLDRFDRFRALDVSAGRCAAVSYLNHDTEEVDVLADIRRAVLLTTSVPGHWSPLEHQATPAPKASMVYRLDQLIGVKNHILPKAGELGYCGPYCEWMSYRKFFPNENIR